MQGFCGAFGIERSRLTGVFEMQDSSDKAYQLTEELLASDPDLQGVYVATINSEAVCRCIKENNRQDIRVITTDVFSEIAPYVEQGIIRGTIYQNTIMQGRMVVRLLYTAITTRQFSKQDVLLTPHLVQKANYSSHLSNEGGVQENCAFLVSDMVGQI